MARHQSFSSEFKRQISREFLEGRARMLELARTSGRRTAVPPSDSSVISRATCDSER